MRKVVAIIQARMNSTRLPGKVLKKIGGKSVLWHIVNRIRKSQYFDDVIIATSDDFSDDEIYNFALNKGIEVFRGSQFNVLERFYKCASQYKADIIVRFTGDNALIDPGIIDSGIETFMQEEDIDYLYYREGLPLGMAVEMFTYQALKTAFSEARTAECLEHVTPYLYRNTKFNSKRISCKGEDYSQLRWTLDTQQDYELITDIYNSLYIDDETVFDLKDILEQYKYHEEWREINSDVKQIKIQYKGDA